MINSTITVDKTIPTLSSIDFLKLRFDHAQLKLQEIVDNAFKAYIDDRRAIWHNEDGSWLIVCARDCHERCSMRVQLNFLAGEAVPYMGPNAEKAAKVALDFAEKLEQLRLAIMRRNRFKSSELLWELEQIAKF